MPPVPPPLPALRSSKSAPQAGFRPPLPLRVAMASDDLDGTVGHKGVTSQAQPPSAGHQFSSLMTSPSRMVANRSVDNLCPITNQEDERNESRFESSVVPSIVRKRMTTKMSQQQQQQQQPEPLPTQSSSHHSSRTTEYTVVSPFRMDSTSKSVSPASRKTLLPSIPKKSGAGVTSSLDEAPVATRRPYSRAVSAEQDDDDDDDDDSSGARAVYVRSNSGSSPSRRHQKKNSSSNNCNSGSSDDDDLGQSGSIARRRGRRRTTTTPTTAPDVENYMTSTSQHSTDSGSMNPRSAHTSGTSYGRVQQHRGRGEHLGVTKKPTVPATLSSSKSLPVMLSAAAAVEKKKKNKTSSLFRSSRRDLTPDEMLRKLARALELYEEKERNASQQQSHHTQNQQWNNNNNK